MADNLKNKMVSAVTWTTIDRFGQQAVQFFITLILARLLTPSDYTLIGLVAVFVSLSNTLVDSGFGQALVRKPDANEKDFNTVFFFNIFISVFLYIILFYSAPYIALFFGQPKLVLVSRVIFIGILLNALYLIPTVKMARALDFKSSTKVNIFSVTCSGIVGVIFAFKGFGVWALVAQQLLFHFFRLLSLTYLIRWKPQLIFSMNVLKSFWSFSMNLLGTNILTTIFNYIYFLILGKLYPNKPEVGLYYQANKLNDTSNYSFQVILGSTYTILVKIQNDEERFQRVFREIVRKSSIIIFPVMLSLIVVAKPLIIVLLSSKWLPSVPYFQLLCIASLFNPLYSLSINALNARGKSRITFRIEFIKKILILISVACCYTYGITALLLGFAVVNWISYGISVFELKRDMSHYWKHQLKDILPSLGIGLFIAIILGLFSLLISNQHLLFLIQLIASAGIYVLAVKIFYPDVFKSAIFQVVKLSKMYRHEKNN
jgi:O-antigen/teichoic acid export membrane protein